MCASAAVRLGGLGACCILKISGAGKCFCSSVSVACCILKISGTCKCFCSGVGAACCGDRVKLFAPGKLICSGVGVCVGRTCGSRVLSTSSSSMSSMR